MQTLRRHVRPITHLVLFGLLALSLHWPAQAALIGTDAVITGEQAQAARDQVRVALDRTEVQQTLLAQGVAPEQLRARVEALTDSEARQLAAHMNEMPAGADSAFGIAAFVFLVLLLTDILGYTDIFPFVKKPASR